ncbi:MAG TPA: hypothetical protein VGV68_01380 [Terriglobia bacterium]|nr:hypothetical protein [Terriglobia bacterium]
MSQNDLGIRLMILPGKLRIKWTWGSGSTDPIANGGHGDMKLPRRGFDALLAGVSDQTKTMVKRVFHITDQIVITDGHRPEILTEPPLPWPPHQGSDLPPPLLTHTLQLHRGDTMYQGNPRMPSALTILFTKC